MEKEKTYIFIDESGVNKDIKYSCFAFVFINEDNYVFIEKIIIDLEKILKIKSFHWSEDNWNVKKRVLQEIADQKVNFKIKILINPINQEKELESSLIDFIENDKNNYVFIDGKKSKKYDRKIKKYFRDRNVSISKIRTIKDNNSIGIKIADYIAGFFRYYFDNENKLDNDLNIILKKILKYKVIELKKPPSKVARQPSR